MAKEPMMIGDHPAVVYCIGPTEDGPTKVGITTNISQRIISLQTGCWEPLRIFSVRVAVPTGGRWRRNSRAQSFLDGARAARAACHEKLREFELGLVGEWFDVTAADAVATLEKCAKDADLLMASPAEVFGADVNTIDDEVTEEHAKLIKSLAEINIFLQRWNDYADALLAVD